MPYKKIPELRYRLFGGINSKVSQYLNSPMEFLNLENLDFQTPGSLTKRWGSTQLFGQSLSGKVNGLYEFTQINGSSYFYAAAGGTLGIVGNNSFTSAYNGSTAGTSYMNTVGAPGFDGWSLGAFDLDFDTLQNNAFLCNQKDFLKSTGGSSFVFFGLPRFICGSTVQNGSFHTVANGTSVASGLSGFYYFKAAWMNSYGMFGAPTLATSVNFATQNVTSTAGATNVTISMSGSSVGQYRLVPPNYDITAIGIFRAGPTATDLTSGASNFTYQSQGFAGSTYILYNSVENLDFFLMGTVGVSAGSIAATFVNNSTSQGTLPLNKNILPFNWYQTFLGTGSVLALPTGIFAGFGITLIPKFVETHDNRLFIGGMSYALSSVWFSEFSAVGPEPEHFEADSNFEVRTNDGEGISALKAYSGNLIVFKPSSFHLLNTSAAEPKNWQLTQISHDYGCLGNRAVTTYSDVLVFLDRRGIIKFNGSNIEIMSTKVDPIFQRMNQTAAKNAVLTYDKQRNEVLCEIPVDGATMNNLTVVYDIVANAWTTSKGYQPAVMAVARAGFNQEQVFYGGYSGLVSYFGASFTTDNGVGFTCVAKSGFLTDLGESVTKMFRRLFADATPNGASSFVDINLYQDYGSSKVFSATMMLSAFQSRIDFGVSGKSLSAEFVMGSTYGLALHGFAVQYRFQRNV